MKKTFIQVLFERLSGITKTQTNNQQPPPNKSSVAESKTLFGDTIQALRHQQNDQAQSRGSSSAKHTIPAEFTLEEPRLGSEPTPHEKIAARLVELNVQIGFSSQDTEFVKEARKYATKREYSASFIPFMSYRPTYSSMTPKQQRWYFYWRNQVRQGQFIDTDLSYVYLLTYELINSVGVTSAENGFRQLLVLWQQYRDRFAHLNSYLPDWLEDYAFVHRLTIDPGDLLLEFNSNQWWYRFDENVEQYAKNPLSKMPLEILSRLSGHDLTQSNFYQDGNQEIVSRFLGLVLDAVDRHMREQSQKGIFETFKPPILPAFQRGVFSGAHYDGSPVVRNIQQPRAYSQHQPLQEFLKGIVKYTENRLREATGFKTRLRNFDILEDHRVIVDGLIPVAKLEPVRKVKTKILVPEPSNTPVKIELDLGRVQALHAESNEVQAMLLNGLEEAVQVVQPSIPIVVPSAPSKPIGVGWQAFSSLLSDDRVEVLKTMLENQNVMLTLRKVALSEGIMPELLLDAINEAALETVGDAILDSGSTEPEVYGDYRDNVQKLVDSRNS